MSEVMQARSRRLFPTQLYPQSAKDFSRSPIRKRPSICGEEEDALLRLRTMLSAQSLVILQSAHGAGFQGQATRLTPFRFSDQKRARCSVEVVRLQIERFGNAQPRADQQTQERLEGNWQQTLGRRQFLACI